MNCVEVNNNVPGKVWVKFGKHDIKVLSLFVLLLYVMMGQNHREKLLQCVCMKSFANRATLFDTILSNLALGHKIDRHFLERCRVEIIKLSSY